MSKKESKSVISEKYSYQVILNFIDNDSESPALLRKKWMENNNPSKCGVLPISSSDDLTAYSPKYSALSQLDDESRLYIIGHCTAGEMGLHNESDSFYSVETIANFLALHLNKDLFKLKNNSK